LNKKACVYLDLINQFTHAGLINSIASSLPIIYYLVFKSNNIYKILTSKEVNYKITTSYHLIYT